MRPGSRGNITPGRSGGFRSGGNRPGGGRGDGNFAGNRGGRGDQFSRGGRGGRGGDAGYYRGGNRSGRGNYYAGGNYNRGNYYRGGKYGRGRGGWYGYGRYGRGGYYYNRYNRWHYGFWGGFWGIPWYLGYSTGYPYGYGYGYSYPSTYAYYDWGYPAYSNPYYVAVDNSVVDYSQPLAQPDDDSTSDVGQQYFDAARAAFKQGDYTRALQLVDSALLTMPLDSVLHEFRALVLFAQGKYSEAASVLHPVLSAGPGWNWQTLLGLYPNVDVYTQQLRALEKYRNEHKDSAQARFLLGYQYLTCGHDQAAADEFRKVVALEPGDQLSRQLLQQLTGEEATTIPEDAAPSTDEDPPPEKFTKPIVVPPKQPEADTPPVPPAGEDKTLQAPASDEGDANEQPPLTAPQNEQPAEPKADAAEDSPPQQPADDTPAEPKPVPDENPEPDTPKADVAADRAKFVGTWKADGENNMKFVLTLRADGTFNWVYTADGETHKFDGNYTVGNGLMTLARADHGALVGRLKWVDDKTFNFKMVGGGPEDAGLTFKR